MKWFTAGMPDWMQPEGVALRQERARYVVERSPRARLIYWLVRAVGLVGLFLVMIAFVTNGFQTFPAQPLTQSGWRVLFGVALVLQLLAALGAVFNPQAYAARLGDETLKTTPQGMALWVRARWLGAFVRIRHLLLLLLALRLLMFGLLLVEVSAMRGEYLALIGALRVQPPLHAVVLMLLLAAAVVAAWVLPLANAALDSAVGLWASQNLRERTFVLTVQLSWAAGRLFAALALVWLFERILSNEVLLAEGSQIPVYFLYTTLGDAGLSLLNVTYSADIWARIPYSVGIGVAALLYIMAAVAAAEGLVRLSIRSVEKPD